VIGVRPGIGRGEGSAVGVRSVAVVERSIPSVDRSPVVGCWFVVRVVSGVVAVSGVVIGSCGWLRWSSGDRSVDASCCRVVAYGY
jgi:hypothetical protein